MTSDAQPGTPEATDGERPYLPGTGKDWLLPLYDPLARLFGITAVHRQLLAQAHPRPGEQVLEIGCGTGNLLLAAKVAEPAATVLGLDPDFAALARARRKSRRRGLPVRLDHGYADALPYPDASIDVVLSSFMFHHLPTAEKEPALRELIRVLRPGGRLHLVDMGGHDHAEHGAGQHGHRGRRARQHPLVHDNLGDGVPDRLRAAGFTDVTELGSDVRRRLGRFTYWSARR